MTDFTEKLPLISIAVAIYNPDVEYFMKCIESLQNQTYKNIEILLVDDGSNVEMACLCDDLGASDSRIRVLHQKNKGLPGARNTGIDMAKGQYLVFVDSDDYVDNNMIARGYEELTRYQAQIAVWTFEVFTSHSRNGCYYRGDSRVLLGRDDMWRFRAMMLDALIFDDLQFGLCMTTWGKMFDTSFLRSNPQIRFNEALRYGGEDNDFLQRLLPVTERLCLFHENLYYYNRDPEDGQTSRFNPAYVKREYEILKVLEKDIDGEERLNHAFERYCCNHIIMICTNFLLHKKNQMPYLQKRRVLKEAVALPEIQRSLQNIDGSDFPKLKYLFMVCARHGWYDLMLLLAWGYQRYRMP